MSNLKKYIHTIIIILLVIVIEGYFLTRKQQNNVKMSHYKENIKYIQVDSFKDLTSVYAKNSYNCDNTDDYKQPTKLIQNIPVDIDQRQYASQSNKYFLCMIVPNAVRVNEHVLKLRSLLKTLLAKKKLSKNEDLLLSKLEKDFSGHRSNKKDFLLRVDAIPISMLVAQAIMESAWGKSYFARKGNSLFGEWTYKSSDLGIVPRHRGKGLKHRIKAFESIYDSMYSYITVLARGQRYAKLREIRATNFSSLAMTRGLDRYSAIGMEYVNTLNNIITKYNLHKYDGLLHRTP